MQRIAAGFHRQVHQLARVQVAGQRLVADAVGLVGTLDMQGMAVGFGIDGHRADAHLGASAHYAHGNLAAVGDQDFLDHACFLDPGDRQIIAAHSPYARVLDN
ncbi:hypothetical protein D3C72_1659270 [compost metagenome]